jgi:YrbI family 3-deoxy-D-manno-octulosonate 8-phosphate phosphatase
LTAATDRAIATVAIIPARGGSKGIPRKNLKPVGGVPLIGRSVLAARAAGTVDQVYVSTDDVEIAAAARQYGAEVIERPPAIAGDTASSEAALLHGLDVLAAAGVRPDTLVFLQCTSPFTRGADIDAVVGALRTGGESAFSAAHSHAFLWRIRPDGTGVGVNHDADRPRKRRQELEPEYRETGAIYAMDVGAFRAAGHRFCGRTIPVPLDLPEYEIDTVADLSVCDAILAAEQGSARTFAPPHPVRLLVTDFDGVHTDDRVHVDQDGRESVSCSRADGMGVARLRAAGIPTLILSKERNSVVTARARKLGCEVLQGIDDKAGALREWLKTADIPARNTIFVGNDVNDLEVIPIVGYSCAPADANPAVAGAVDYVTTAPGGCGSVREICELIISNSRPPST